MAQLSKCFLSGDFTAWPLDQATACEICRVRFVRGPEGVVDKFAELRVRSQVIKDMANIYIQRHIADLAKRSLKLKLQSPEQPDLQQRFKDHIDRRVDAEYPPEEFGKPEGSVPEAIKRALTHGRSPDSSKEPSAFDMKQSTMPDAPTTEEARVFAGLRPTVVVDEGVASATFSQETLLQAAAPKVASLDVKMGNEFLDQFISQYCARVFSLGAQL